jgi:DNA-binding NtrC family response regulator
LDRYTDRDVPKETPRLVLVLEDDPSVRRPLVKFLELHQFSVATAETADQALEILRTQTVVAAVVDLRLQRGSGRDVVAATPGNIPVIIFSGVPSESANLELVRPRTLLIEKPYSVVQLVDILEEMVDEADSKNLHS